MFIANDEDSTRVVRGSQLNSRTNPQSNFTCPSCGEPVEYNSSAEHAFEFFRHANGSPDCFASDGTSDEHRLAVEVSFEAIHNRLVEVTGTPDEIDIDVGRWVGSQPNFIIADLKVVSPLQITAEIFYKAEHLALRRRFSTLTANDYQAFLIFHTCGEHDINRIEKYMQRISPLTVGRFNPDKMEISLGDLFSQEQIDFSAAVDVPNYMIYTPN